MTQKEQIRFTESLCNSVKQEIISKIEGSRIPESWDGFELRELIAEKLSGVTYLRRDKRSARYRDYQNIVLVNNL